MRKRESATYNRYNDGFYGPDVPESRYIEMMDTHKRVFDYVNRRPKGGSYPESFCEICSASVSRTSQRSNYTGFPRFSTNLPAKKFSELGSVPHIKEVIDQHYNSLVNRITKERDAISQEWSSLNFIYELKELPDLFLKEARKAESIRDMISRPRDPESYRYIDYQFGLSPLISDIKAACQHFDSLAQKSKDLKKRFEDRPIRSMRQSTLVMTKDPAMSSQDASVQSWYSIKSRLNGTISMSLPVLSRVSPEVYQMLDALAVDPSASNAWNALPFSWLSDWFFPVGTYLKSLPSLMQPETLITGTLSHKVVGQFEFKTDRRGDALYWPPGLPLGSAVGRYYHRRVLGNEPLRNLVRWQVTGLSSPSQLALIRDILFPVSERGNALKGRFT